MSMMRNEYFGMGGLRIFALGGLLSGVLLLYPGCPLADEGRPEIKKLSVEELRGIVQENKGKVLVLNFWSTLSSISREEMTFLNILYGTGNNEALEIIGVNVEGVEPDVIEPFVEMMHIKYPVFVGGGDIVEAYDLQFVPVTFILGKDGRVRHKEIGFSEKERPKLKKLVEMLSTEG